MAQQFRRGDSSRPDQPSGRSNQTSARLDRGNRNPNQSTDMQAISAPYNFVPLANWVHIPDWGPRVSHDLPFRDGLSGEIHYRLLAASPLLVGGQQRKASDDLPGEVKAFKLPDDRYAIPGSSLKGMLRAVIEIAGFGRMRMVDDLRPGLRDISGPHVADSYTNKVRDKVRFGFLQRGADGDQTIVACKMLRLDHRDLETALDVAKPIFEKRTSVQQKYARWAEVCRKARRDQNEITFDGDARVATKLFAGANKGTPVFTGQISDSTQAGGKSKDFVFYDPDESHPIPVRQNAWRDFLHIHGDADGKREMSWPGYWKTQFRNGKRVPVFYLQDDDLLRIGLAYMPKLAGDFSIHQMIQHSSEQHAQPPGADHGYDLADLLFGSINGDRQADALRARLSLETAIVEGSPSVAQQPDTILNGPKPTYFPNYINQKADPNTWKLTSGQYATYIATQKSTAPTLRGHKRYPARPADQTKVQALADEQQRNNKLKVQLHTLPTGTTFTGRLVFHNLKPAELGALLWALSWGGNPALSHGLGMGKPFGFGQVHFELDHAHSRVAPNDPDQAGYALDAGRIQGLIGDFTQSMEVASATRGGWAASPQIANLLAMADPEAAKALPPGMELRHMRLESKARVNEFQDAKKAGLVLADYAIATGRASAVVAAHQPATRVFGSSAGLHPWVARTLTELMKKNNAKEDDTLRGKGLAEAWAAIDDPALKAAALESIKQAWQKNDWWDKPPGKASKHAKAAYEGSA